MTPEDTQPDPGHDDRSTLRCVGCGYRLRGTTADRCPECGMSVAESREKLRGFPPNRNYTAELHAANVACIVLPAVIIAATFITMRFVVVHELAWTAALLSVTAVVFSPIAALVTMPWRGVYEDATKYRLAWRIMLLAVQWTVLLGVGLAALLLAGD